MNRIFRLTNTDLANLTALRRLLPRYTAADIVTEGLIALREKLESQPPREPLRQPAADSTRDLYGD
jgi:hypothetical protein